MDGIFEGPYGEWIVESSSEEYIEFQYIKVGPVDGFGKCSDLTPPEVPQVKCPASSSSSSSGGSYANAAFIKANAAFLQANTPDYVANSERAIEAFQQINKDNQAAIKSAYQDLEKLGAGKIEVDAIVKIGLIHIRQEVGSPGKPRWAIHIGNSSLDSQPSWWKCIQAVVIGMQCQSQLFQVVYTLRPPGCFAGLLNCRKQQRNQDGDDRNHHQQFDQCETTTTM